MPLSEIILPFLLYVGRDGCTYAHIYVHRYVHMCEATRHIDNAK
jgi:hypothetical protein